MDRMREQLLETIRSFLRDYEKKPEIQTVWGEPLLSFADANHPYVRSLKLVVTPTHAMPEEVLPGAKNVLVYYVPFTRELAKTNQEQGQELASWQWALAYEETNQMFQHLNQALIQEIRRMGYEAAQARQAATFDQSILKSSWSHRHFAYAAGLGTFGVNNMLITEKGCCGRFHSLVTTLRAETGQPLKEEYCLYKRNGSCLVCVKRCPTGALTEGGYDRRKCYTLLRKNAARYTEFGSSYETEDGSGANSVGSEVCGKCVTGAPCGFLVKKENRCC